jgi:chemosensory pili system protein ChpA (sensor histidine kinase/response regulator)
VEPDGTILVVDDNPDTNEALVRLLQLRGYEVRGAFDGAEALGYLRDGLEPSVIVLDLRMPIMDGHELLRVLAADPRLARFPVVVYSSVSEPIPPHLVVLAYVAKSGDPGALLDVIARACPPPLLQ